MTNNPALTLSLMLAALFFGFCIPGLVYALFRKPTKADPHPTHDTTKTKVIP